METLLQLIRRKPQIFLIISLVYIFVSGAMKWHTSFVWEMLWYPLGGIVGVYFLDAAEQFFAVSPSPFRSIFFMALYSIVGFFVVSSSANAFGSGVVLIVYLQLLLWQYGQWRIQGNLDSWFRVPSGSMPLATQRIALPIFIVVFLMQTYFFIRS
ncbi:hypothetical protein KBC80_03240 [Candidatus Woesebacteria bacterium]|jgi:hypothetical protein|nr:hypothetical protein [Candidatus Woesebacteria bacterium]